MNIQIDPIIKTKTCLYVEDDIETYFSFYPVLKNIFKEIYYAKNGEEGLELFKKEHPDLVLTDIKMPLMDGLDMSSKIKEISPQTPILLITAFTELDYLTKAMDLNIDAYVTKPLNKKKFFSKLNSIAQKFYK